MQRSSSHQKTKAIYRVCALVAGSPRLARLGPRKADRLIFNQPQRLKRINLVFTETETSRTQEFVLRWRSGDDQSFREIVRQQWNFSPPQTARETEDYQVDLASVRALELVIVPDIDGGRAYASLENLRLA